MQQSIFESLVSHVCESFSTSKMVSEIPTAILSTGDTFIFVGFSICWVHHFVDFTRELISSCFVLQSIVKMFCQAQAVFPGLCRIKLTVMCHSNTPFIGDNFQI